MRLLRFDLRKLVVLALAALIAVPSFAINEVRESTRRPPTSFVSRPVVQPLPYTDNTYFVNPPFEHPPINGPRFSTDVNELTRRLNEQYPASESGRERLVNNPAQSKSFYERFTEGASTAWDTAVDTAYDYARAGYQGAADLWTWGTAQINSLRRAAHRAASRTRKNVTNPYRSKGLCKAGVREILKEAGLLNRDLPGASAQEALRGTFKRVGDNVVKDSRGQGILANPRNPGPTIGNMRNSRGQPLFREIAISNSMQAPIGAVLLYEADEHPWGHIEVRTALEGREQFCSDYKAAVGIDISNKRRRLVKAYVRTSAADI